MTDILTDILNNLVTYIPTGRLSYQVTEWLFGWGECTIWQFSYTICYCFLQFWSIFSNPNPNIMYHRYTEEASIITSRNRKYSSCVSIWICIRKDYRSGTSQWRYIISIVNTIVHGYTVFIPWSEFSVKVRILTVSVNMVRKKLQFTFRSYNFYF